MHRRNSFDLAARPRRRGRRWAGRLLALTLLLAALPFARAALPWAAGRLTACLAPAWAAEREELQAENAALHTELAAAAALQTENAALRTLLHSAAPRPAALFSARALAQTDAGLLLWCEAGVPVSGAPVLDRRGRFAGRAAQVQGALVTVPAPDGEACFVGEDPAVLRRIGDGWQVTGLPVPAAAGAGTVVTTPEGLWLGRLAADPAPVPETGGLTAAAPLCDTAQPDSRYFVAAEEKISYNSK